MFQSLFFNKVEKRLWHRCFPVYFVKFLRTTFFDRTPLVAASNTCVNDAYSNFIYRFVGAINFIAPAKRITERPTQNLDLITKLYQQYKDGINSKNSSNILVLKLLRIIFKVSKMHLQKMILKKRNVTLKKS